MKVYSILLSSLAIFLGATSCFNNGSQSSNTTATQVEEQKPQTIICGVKSKSILYAEPSDGSAQLINKKATEMLGEVNYLEIDKSCKVKILEDQGEWVKIQVTEPDWLRDSHIGWVKKAIVIMPNEEKEDAATYEENKDYQILYSKHVGTVENVYVYLLLKTTDEDKLESIANFIKKAKYSGTSCNINLYDSTEIVPLIEKYPIAGQEYVSLADHFLYTLAFDGTSMYYPLKDIQYKEYGGKNPINR